ncbi:MAG: hypothetical protein ACE5EV_03950 [Gaiellales bacterium]
MTNRTGPPGTVFATRTKPPISRSFFVDARMLGEQVGHLSLDEIRAVDDALELVLDLG